MALTYALEEIQKNDVAQLTKDVREFEKYPNEDMAEIVEKQLVELRARGGAVAQRLRLQFGRAPWNQQGRSTSRCRGLAARSSDSHIRIAAERVHSRPVGRPRRLYSRDPGPVGLIACVLFRGSCGTPTQLGGASQRSEVARNETLRARQ